MVFPVMLSGSPVVIRKDWCRSCDKGDWSRVPTVKSTGQKAKAKPYCSDCWTSWLPMLTSVERGEEIADSVGGSDGNHEPWTPEYELCKNADCASKWRKARHFSGHCSYNCAVNCGWEEIGGTTVPPPADMLPAPAPSSPPSPPPLPPSPSTVAIDTPSVEPRASRWRKARRFSGLSCTIPPPADLQPAPAPSPSTVAIDMPAVEPPSPPSMLDELKANDKLLSDIAQSRMLKNYIESGKGGKAVQPQFQLERRGLGYKRRGLLDSWGNGDRANHFVRGEVIEPQQKKAFVTFLGHRDGEEETGEDEMDEEQVDDAILAAALAERLGSLELMD